MNNFLIITLLLAATACQSTPEASQHADTAVEPGMMKLADPKQTAVETAPRLLQPPKPEPDQPPATTGRQLIRNAQLRIRVNDFLASGRAIEQAVRQVNGQIESSNETKSYNSIENVLTIRVPAARFDALRESILKESIFTDTKTSMSEDVTRRYVDVEARIRSKKAVEETYLNLLKKARSVEDVLKIEEQLGEIREEREVQEAELRQLKDEVAMSTIHLTYYQQTEAALRPEAPFYGQIWNNLTDGFRLMGTTLIGLFYFLPLGMVGAGVTWLILRWRRNRKNTK